MDKILTVRNVAEILQVKPITVREMFREQRIRGFKVGKGWRTTETMLQEDLEALARGERPAKLPRPEVPEASPASPKQETATKPAKDDPVVMEPIEDEAAKPVMQEETPAPKRSRKKKAVQADEEEESSQQFLFDGLG